MNFKSTKSAIAAALDADIPAMIWGPPGVGKSALVREIGADRGIPVIDLRAALLDPVDLRGLPTVKGDRAVWLPMGELPDESRDGPEGILFLDEVNAAAQMVQTACFGLVLDRKLGEYRLPSGWRVIAAGNRQSDRAAAQRMPSALANRFLHIEMDASAEDFVAYAVEKGMPAEIAAFIRFRPALLHDFVPDRTVNATPRSWEMASKIIKLGVEPETEMAMLQGTVGEGPAAELSGFLRVYRKLPSVESILGDPEGAEVPTDPATLYALMGALGRRVDVKQAGAFFSYIARVNPEFAVLAVMDARRRLPEIAETKPYIGWLSKNSAVIF